MEIDAARRNILIKSFSVFLGYLSIAFFSLWKVLSTPGTIGYIMDNWIPYFPKEISQRMDNAIFYSWLNEALGRSLDLSPAYYLRIPILLVSSMGLNGDIISKGFIVLMMTVSGLSIFMLARYLKVSNLPAFLCGAFYMFTPFFYNFAIVGGYGALIFYALLPFLTLLLFELTVESKPAFKTLVAFVILLFFVSDYTSYYIDLIMIFLLLFVFNIFFSRNIKSLSRHLKAFLLIIGSFIVAQLGWILPLISNTTAAFSGGLKVDTGSLIITSRFIQFSPGLIKALGLRGLLGNIADYFTWNAVDSSIGSIWLIVSFILIAIALSAMLLKPRSKIVLYFSILFIIGVFLSKGGSAPAGFINISLFKSSILGEIFRDPYNFMPISAISISILIGLSMDGLIHFLRPKTKQSASIKFSKKFVTLIKRKDVLAILCFFVLIGAYGLPYLNQTLSDNLQTFTLSQNYANLLQDLSNNNENFRVLMLPFVNPIAPPHGITGGGDSMLDYYGKPVLYNNLFGTGEGEDIQRFLANCIYSPTAPNIENLGSLLGLMNVNLVAFRNGFSSLYAPYNSNAVALDMLQSQDGLSFLKQYGNDIQVYENNDSKNLIYASTTQTLAAGDLSYFLDFPNDSAVFFSDQQSSSAMSSLSVNKISIQDGNAFDYIQSFLPDEYKINPTLYVTTNVPGSDWVDLNVNDPPTDWYQSANVMDSAVAEVPSTLTIPVDVSNAGQYQLFTKVLLDSNSSQLSLQVYIDNQKVNDISINDTGSDEFNWISTGNLILSEGTHNLKLINNGGTVAVSEAILAPVSELTKAEQEAEAYSNGRDVTLYYNLNKVGTPITSLTPNYLSFTFNATVSTLPFNSRVDLTKYLDVWAPKEGEYQFSIQAQSNSNDSMLTVFYDNSSLEMSLNPANGVLNAYTKGEIYLTAGMNHIKLATNIPSSNYQIELKSFMLENDEPTMNILVPIIKFDEINPTKYVIHVESTSPFLLVFSEQFDPRWIASSSYTIFGHSEVNFFANGYWINKTGAFNITLEFSSQNLYAIGLTISLSAFALLLIILVVPPRIMQKIARRIPKNHNYTIGPNFRF